MATREYDLEDVDDDAMFTYMNNGVIIYVDDDVCVVHKDVEYGAEVLQISKDGRHLKVLLDSGDVANVTLTNILEKQ